MREYVFKMNNIFKIIIIKYKKLFFLNPNLFSTIIFIPFLYLIGWVLATPIFILGLDKESISLIGTIFTFLIFIFSLPKWFEIRWGLNNSWKLLGIKKIDRKKNLIYYFLRGFLLSIILICLICIPIIRTEWGDWVGKISPDIIINAIFLILGIGFAEEALIFSLVHIGWDLPVWQMISILTGLFLLGILLSLIRIKDENSLWGCIGLHGGLVGVWFIANNGLLFISKDSPKWLVGPGSINTNPLGGLVGISLIIIFCFLYLQRLKKKI